MTRLEIIAIQRLPRRYIADGTQVAPCGNGWVMACNGQVPLPPISFHDKRRKWRVIKWKPEAKTQ